MNILLCVFIGILHALCGVAYRIGSLGKVKSVESGFMLSVAGCAVFAVLGFHEWQYLSWRVFLCGAVFGITQYAAVRLFTSALKCGPLSPVWCVQSMNFVPVIFYASLFLGEKMSWFQYCSVFATAGALVTASFGADGGQVQTTWKQRIRYGALLLAILVFISVMNVGLKFCSVYCEPGASVNMADRTGNLLFFFIYLFIGIGSAADLIAGRSWVNSKYAYISGGLLALCAVSSYVVMISIVASTPAVTLFAVSSATGILGASLLSVLCFHEMRTISWYFTVGFSLLAILLNR